MKGHSDRIRDSGHIEEFWKTLCCAKMIYYLKHQILYLPVCCLLGDSKEPAKYYSFLGSNDSNRKLCVKDFANGSHMIRLDRDMGVKFIN